MEEEEEEEVETDVVPRLQEERQISGLKFDWEKR